MSRGGGLPIVGAFSGCWRLSSTSRAAMNRMSNNRFWSWQQQQQREDSRLCEQQSWRQPCRYLASCRIQRRHLSVLESTKDDAANVPEQQQQETNRLPEHQQQQQGRQQQQHQRRQHQQQHTEMMTDLHQLLGGRQHSTTVEIHDATFHDTSKSEKQNQPTTIFRSFHDTSKSEKQHQPTTDFRSFHDTSNSDDRLSSTHVPLLDSIQESFECHIIPNLPELNNDVVPLLLGVSGGCDSIALLHALVQILRRHHSTSPPKNDCDDDDDNNKTFRLHVVHFNHKQRGDASDDDAIFVQNVCNDLNVPFYVYNWQQQNDCCNEEANETTRTTTFSQNSARQWRRSTMYTLLQTLITADCDDGGCRSGRSGVILTAHHRDDSEESMVLKMLRGVHLTNLVGMEHVQVNCDDMPNAIIARPMLNVRKQCIVDFLTSHQLTWRDDESNASDKYLRNRVRNELIPLLHDMVGGANVLQKRLDHISKQSRELKQDIGMRATEYLEQHIKNAANNDVAFVLCDDDSPQGLVKKEALHQWARLRMGFPLPYDQLERICTQLEKHPHRRKWTLQVGRGWNVERNGAILLITRDISMIR